MDSLPDAVGVPAGTSSGSGCRSLRGSLPPETGDDVLDLPSPSQVAWTTDLPVAPQSVAAARRQVADSAPDFIREDVLLATSEIMTNAVKVGRKCTSASAKRNLVSVDVSLTLDHLTTLTLTVTNPICTPEIPVISLVARKVGPDAEHGRGLALVEALCDHWGTRQREDGRLMVWAQWNWISPDLLWDRSWLDGWHLRRASGTGQVQAHHEGEGLTINGGPTLLEVHRPIMSVNQVLRLRTQYPGWEITYDQSPIGPGWFAARRRSFTTHRAHRVLDHLSARTSAELGDRLAAQQYAVSRADRHRAPRAIG